MSEHMGIDPHSPAATMPAGPCQRENGNVVVATLAAFAAILAAFAAHARPASPANSLEFRH